MEILLLLLLLRGRGRMVVGFTTTCIPSVPNTAIVVSSNRGKVYSIQHYVIKFVSDLRQIGGFLRVFRFPLSKTDLHDIAEIMLKVA